MSSLCQLMREHASAVEADLAYRHVDVRDFWAPAGGRSQLSLRRLWILIRPLLGDPTSFTRAELAAAKDQAESQRLVDRRDHYARKKAQQEAAARGGEQQ